MLEPVFSFITNIWSSICFWQIVDEYERGIVLRFGRFHREIQPGFNWLWPLAERAIVDEVVPETINLEAQSLTTNDDVNVLVSGVLVVKKRNIKKVSLEVQGVEEVVGESGSGVLANLILASRYQDIRRPEFLDAVRKAVHEDVTKWGIDVMSFKFQDLAKCRTIRVVN